MAIGRQLLNHLSYVPMAALLAAICSCSTSPPQARGRPGKLPEWIMQGFEEPPSRLFIDSGRIAALLAALQYDPGTYSYGRDHSTDGASLRCWNRDRTHAVLFATGQPPQVLSIPPRAYLDDQNGFVAAYSGERGRTITFRSGEEISVPCFRPDPSGTFFCYGGRHYDYEAEVPRIEPVKVAQVDNPDAPVVTTGLRGSSPCVYATADAVFVVAERWPTSDTGGNDLMCEEYAREDTGLVFKRRFAIRYPVRAAFRFVLVDFDPVSSLFLVEACRYKALGRVRYVYGVETGQLQKVGVFEGYAGFLDRHVFERSFEEIPVEASQQQQDEGPDHR